MKKNETEENIKRTVSALVFTIAFLFFWRQKYADGLKEIDDMKSRFWAENDPRLHLSKAEMAMIPDSDDGNIYDIDKARSTIVMILIKTCVIMILLRLIFTVGVTNILGQLNFYYVKVEIDKLEEKKEEGDSLIGKGIKQAVKSFGNRNKDKTQDKNEFNGVNEIPDKPNDNQPTSKPVNTKGNPYMIGGGVLGFGRKDPPAPTDIPPPPANQETVTDNPLYNNKPPEPPSQQSQQQESEGDSSATNTQKGGEQNDANKPLFTIPEGKNAKDDALTFGMHDNVFLTFWMDELVYLVVAALICIGTLSFYTSVIVDKRRLNTYNYARANVQTMFYITLLGFPLAFYALKELLDKIKTK